MDPFSRQHATKPVHDHFQRANSDPVNLTKSRRRHDSHMYDVARSLDRHHTSSSSESDLITFANLRHSSSLPNFRDISFDGHSGTDGTTEVHKHETGTSHPDLEAKEEFYNAQTTSANADLASSQQFVPLQFNENDDDRDDSESRTLTDDSSDERNEDFSFPPVEEVDRPHAKYLPQGEEHSVISLSNISAQYSILKPPAGIVAAGIINEDYDSLKSDSERGSKQAFQVHLNDRTATGMAVEQSMAKHSSSPPRILPGSLTDHYDGDTSFQDYDQFDSFTNSLASNVSFPNPINRDVHLTVTLLPISSSAVDTMTILQRIVGFGKVLCETLVPSGGSEDLEASTSSSNPPEGPRLEALLGGQRRKLYENFLSVSSTYSSTYSLTYSST